MRQARFIDHRHLGDGGKVVVGRETHRLGLTARIQRDGFLNEEHKREGRAPSEWMVVVRDHEDLAPLLADDGAARWTPARRRDRFRPWTDDHAGLLPILRFR